MILTCPDCSTQYSVKDGAIGPNGRTVRCSSCSATWFVSSDADSLALADNAREEITHIDPPGQTSASTPASAINPDTVDKPAGEPELSNRPATAKPVVGAHVQVRDKADRQRRNRRLAGVTMIWAVTLGLLLVAAILAYVFRQDIVDENAAMASFYQVFGVEVTTQGLDFEKPGPSTSHTIIDGRPVLVINGVVINRSTKTRTIPPVELSLVNGGGEVITKWLVELGESEIGPKQRLPYMAQYPDPPLDAVDLKYKFYVPDAVTPGG